MIGERITLFVRKFSGAQEKKSNVENDFSLEKYKKEWTLFQQDKKKRAFLLNQQLNLRGVVYRENPAITPQLTEAANFRIFDSLMSISEFVRLKGGNEQVCQKIIQNPLSLITLMPPSENYTGDTDKTRNLNEKLMSDFLKFFGLPRNLSYQDISGLIEPVNLLSVLIKEFEAMYFIVDQASVILKHLFEQDPDFCRMIDEVISRTNLFAVGTGKKEEMKTKFRLQEDGASSIGSFFKLGVGIRKDSTTSLFKKFEQMVIDEYFLTQLIAGVHEITHLLSTIFQVMNDESPKTDTKDDSLQQTLSECFSIWSQYEAYLLLHAKNKDFKVTLRDYRQYYLTYLKDAFRGKGLRGYSYGGMLMVSWRKNKLKLKDMSLLWSKIYYVLKKHENLDTNEILIGSDEFDKIYNELKEIKR